MFFYRQTIVEENCQAELTFYLQENFEEIEPTRKRPLILICPGGGYENLSNREAEPVAIKLLSLGFHAAVLKYSVFPAKFPTALRQLAKAMLLIRAEAVRYPIDSDQIFVMGFSAGGHLAASLGAYWNQPLLADLSTNAEELCPAGLLLCYPVISGGSYRHESSFQKLLGSHLDEERTAVSIEKLVTADFPPTFIWHTMEDQVVPVQNTLLLVEQLVEKQIFCECHLYPKGQHGLSLGTEETNAPDKNMLNNDIQGWPELAARWIRTAALQNK